MDDVSDDVIGMYLQIVPGFFAKFLQQCDIVEREIHESRQQLFLFGMIVIVHDVLEFFIVHVQPAQKMPIVSQRRLNQTPFHLGIGRLVDFVFRHVLLGIAFIFSYP
jgi:hypothetical protein